MPALWGDLVSVGLPSSLAIVLDGGGMFCASVRRDRRATVAAGGSAALPSLFVEAMELG